MSNGKIFFELHDGAMTNILMCIENAVAIAAETNKDIVFHNAKPWAFTPSRYFKEKSTYDYEDGSQQVPRGPIDELTWDGKEKISIIKERIDKFHHENEVIDNLQNSYITVTDNMLEFEDEFAEGRSKININNLHNAHFKQTLSWYSILFFNRTEKMNKALSSVKYKKEYYELAKKIKISIGDFYGAHIRLTDHQIKYEFENKINEGLEQFNSNHQIVIATDEPSHVFLKQIKDKYLFIDEYIINNFSKELKEYNFDNALSLGILTNILMHYSIDFIGTKGSTYTGYIHRNRIINGYAPTWRLFDEADILNTKPYSWNHHEKGIIEKTFWREWPESYIANSAVKLDMI